MKIRENSRIPYCLRLSEGTVASPLFQNLFFHVLEIQAVVDRTLDGTMNNIFNSDWGAAETQVHVASSLAYADGISAPSGPNRPNPRFISNEIFAQSGSVEDPLNLSVTSGVGANLSITISLYLRIILQKQWISRYQSSMHFLILRERETRS